MARPEHSEARRVRARKAQAALVLRRNQIEVHPYFANEDARAASARHGVAVEAWSPIAQGAVLDDETIGKIAAAKFARGKCMNAGQVCMAPDFAYVHRDDMEAFAVESHERAIRAQAEGRFEGQIVPLGEAPRDVDDRARRDAGEDPLALEQRADGGGGLTVGDEEWQWNGRFRSSSLTQWPRMSSARFILVSRRTV